MNTNEIISALATTRSEIKLQPMQAHSVSLFIENAGKSINTFEFHAYGIVSPSQCISQLKAKGAIFEKQTKPAIDNSGKLHKSVAHYSLVGWDKNETI
jgi:hypothetical protein